VVLDAEVVSVEFDVGESADGKRLRRLLRQAIGSGDVDLEKA
jgi:hypothetical protein